MRIVEQYLAQLNIEKRRWRRATAILTVLSQQYGSISRPGFSGTLDLPTEESIAGFQELNRLPRTGELDKITWKHLALHFPLAANLGQGNTQADNMT